MLPLSLCLLFLLSGHAHAHASRSGEIAGWSFDSWTVLPLAVMALLLGTGSLRLLRRSGGGAAHLRRRIALIALSWASLVLALISPLGAAGHRSFSAHMLQHEVLMLLTAPLLVLGRPVAMLAWGLPEAGRRALGWLMHLRPLRRAALAVTQPVAATLLQAAVLWLWHAPHLFERALANPAWHAVQHISFFLGALVFWVAVLDRCGSSLAGRSLAALCLFATSLVSGALGALMALSQSPWYAGYARLGLTPLGLTPSEDQQLAGLLMWVPGGLLHAGAALALLGAALHRPRKVAHARIP